MATANNIIKTRVQLKSDTEANWNNHPIVPLAGELIIYSADTTHNYSRLKIGDGLTSVVNLPFIDAETLNGTEIELVKEANRDAFPQIGSQDKLYIDLSTNNIYYYDLTNGYIQLSPYDMEKITIRAITKWRTGWATEASISNHVLSIKNGAAPELLWEDKMVVQNITRGGNE